MNRRAKIRERQILYARTSMKSISAWAKPGFVTDLTGWTGEKLRQAREQKLIKWKKESDGFWYDLNSIPERLLLKK